MAIIAMKFGGTSVADLPRIRHVASLVEREVERGNRVVVVVSAMAGETNKLVAWANEAAKPDPEDDARAIPNQKEYDVVVAAGEQVTAGLLAVTLNAMRPDLLVVRHASSGAASLLAQKVGCSVINAGDGQHEHPTQALLDALSIRRCFGRVEGLTVAICGDVLHSRVARSNAILLQTLGARVRLVGPATLMPAGADRWGAEVFHDLRQGIGGVDVVMMLRLQLERMTGALVPSTREYFRFFGLDREKLAHAAPGAKVMHPGPMNRGVEIDSDVADDLSISLIQDQVEMGVAVRMAVLARLAARLDND